MALDQLLLERLSANTGNLLDDEELIGETRHLELQSTCGTLHCNRTVLCCWSCSFAGNYFTGKGDKRCSFHLNL